MSTKKIPLAQLAAYLPYGVKAIFPETNEKGCRKRVIGTVGAVYSNATIVCHDTVNATPAKFKLLLRPFPKGEYFHHRYLAVQGYLKAHYDIFGLIEQGLAEPIKEGK
jgi:hypothetical protein